MTLLSMGLVYAPTEEVLKAKYFHLSSSLKKEYKILQSRVYELHLKCFKESGKYPSSLERSFSENAIYQFKKTVFKPPEFIYEKLVIRSSLHYDYCIQILRNYETYYLGWENDLTIFLASY
jgi:hypothetical protein